MRRYSSAASLVLGVLAVLGLAGAAAAQPVPFVGRLDGVATVTGLPPIVSVLVIAKGNATQLGQFALAIPHTVDLRFMTGTGSYQFTAANGDRLIATFKGQGKTTPTPGVIAIVETASITGGTGRFTGATGGFTCQRLFNRVTGRTTGSFQGTISAPGN